MSPTSSPYQAKVLIAPTASTIGQVLSQPIIQSCQSALAIKDFFSIALSGGSLPSFLGDLPAAFERAGVNPQWEKWHVMLADERMVPSSHDDSNIGSIRRNFTDKVGIPREQVYGIDETLLEKGSDAVAKEYNRTALTRLIKMSARVSESLPANGVGLDCVVLVSEYILRA
jgi:6-phosphogluconolactonase